MPAATRSIEVGVPPEQLMAVITDFAAYPDFLPEMRRVEIIDAGASEWEVRFSIRVIRELKYTLRLVQQGPLKLRWSLVEGVFRSNDGGWALQPLNDGSRTRATYDIDVKVGMFVPGNIVHSLVNSSLPDTLEHFRAEAERRAAVR